MRLTKEIKDDYYNGYYTNGRMSSGIVYINSDKDFTNAAINKLGQLEDIEEELGIDLFILFKANNDGVYYKKNLKHYNAELDFKHKCIRLSKHYEAEDDFECHYVMFKGYGKTWALTKEELE